MVGLTLLLTVWYLVRERHRFNGPAWALGNVDILPTRAPGAGVV